MHGKRIGTLTLALAAMWIGSGLAQVIPIREQGGNSRRVVPRRTPEDPSDPPMPPVRVVVVGSSTAQGAGASSIAASWAGRLDAWLQDHGLAMSNVSIIGTATADSIARFNNDVRPLNPKFVILATSIANEGITENNTAAVAAQYLDNTRKLIRMTEGIGAIPIVVTPYVNDTFGVTIHSALIALSAQFEAEGVTVWDFLNATDDGDGHWIPGLSLDGTHPTDEAHRQLFDGIPLSFFDTALAPSRWPPTMNFGSWKSVYGDGTPPSIEVVLATPVMSWSVAFWMRPGTSTDPQPLLTVGDVGVVLRRSGARLDIMRDGEILATAQLPPPPGFTHICLTYQKLASSLTLYLNGAVADSVRLETEQSAGSFRITSAPGTEGELFSRLLVYRTPLNSQDVKDLVVGRMHFKSLEAYLPLTVSPARLMRNRAETIVPVTVDGAWTWSPAGPSLTLME
jgi:lysophospholipase L1-like esterase